MTVCPPADQLSAMLSGTLPDADLSALDTHLSSCAHCQQRLNDLTDSPRLAAWMGPQSTAPRGYPFLAPSEHPGDLGRIGRFRVEAELGRGGMGLVFRAWDEELRRPVALKVLRVGHDDEPALARFARESQAAAKLQHDHIVPVYGVERTADGRPIIVMPVIPGPSLRERLRTEAITPREAATLIRQVADALAAAHAAGLIHRDVKPANVLLDTTDGRAKLTDFGLARSVSPGETVTQDGMIVGTPEYLSPEQASDPNTPDPRSDLYSLGVTLYECLTGVVPFRGTPLDVITRHAAEEPVPPRRLNAAVPPDLETICLKCLEKDPAMRYASAAAVRDELDRWLAGRPILARPAGPLERTSRWVKRNPLPVSVVAVSVLGFAASAAGWWRAGVKADEAAANALTAQTREQEASAARTLALEKAKLADERSALALAAVNTLITKAQNLAGDTPGSLKLKQQLNEAALADLRQLTAAVARVPGADRSTIAAHQKLGDTFNLLGQSDEALREWNLARDHAEQLLATDPDDLPSRLDLSRAHYAIGFTRNRLRDFKSATLHMDAAVEAVAASEARHPDNPHILDALATARAGRADVDWLTQHGAKAVAGYEQALALWQRRQRIEPDTAARSKMLLVSSRIGYVCLSVLHDYPTAERHFRDQLVVAANQLAVTPDDREWQRNYHIILLDLSSALQRKGDGPGAEKAARDALGWLEKAAAADPDNVRAQRDLAMGHDHLGLAQLAQSRFTDAEQSLLRTSEIIDKLESRSATVAVVANDAAVIRLKLAIITERLGRYADSAKWYDRMIESVRKSAGPTESLQMRLLIARLRLLRDTVSLMPQTLAAPAFAATQPAELGMLLAAARVVVLTRRGDLDTARRELAELRKRSPSAVPVLTAQALIEGLAAADIAAGVAALTAAVKADRTVLDTLHLFPELTAVRTHPSFLEFLRTSQ